VIEHGLAFHHLGLAVLNPQKALSFLKGLGYHWDSPITDPVQNVNLVLCEHPSAPAIELIFPTDSPGPVSNILKSRQELFYHICYETVDLKRSLNNIKEQGNRIITISPPNPAILFSGRQVSFYYVDGFGLIEILETLE
jgi:catechol 2,3-dioxygenase-like lactoylglutathione lyase family enzyme